MRVKYYKKDDILVIRFSDKPYDYAEMEGNFIVHFSKDRKPVRLEILEASQFLREESKALPKEVRVAVFA